MHSWTVESVAAMRFDLLVQGCITRAGRGKEDMRDPPELLREIVWWLMVCSCQAQCDKLCLTRITLSVSSAVFICLPVLPPPNADRCTSSVVRVTGVRWWRHPWELQSPLEVVMHFGKWSKLNGRRWDSKLEQYLYLDRYQAHTAPHLNRTMSKISYWCINVVCFCNMPPETVTLCRYINLTSIWFNISANVNTHWWRWWWRQVVIGPESVGIQDIMLLWGCKNKYYCRSNRSWDEWHWSTSLRPHTHTIESVLQILKKMDNKSKWWKIK